MGEFVTQLAVAALVFAIATTAAAKNRSDLPDCAYKVSQLYQIPVSLLRAIHAVEGGWSGAVVGPNKNGTHDLGAMQINTAWLPVLGAFGITRADVVDDDCTNLAIGAWVLRQSVEKYGTWEDAISAYNTGRPLPAGKRYYTKVLAHWRRLSNEERRFARAGN